MKLLARSFPVLLFSCLLVAAVVFGDPRSGEQTRALAATGSAADVPLKDAKLNIEHNATDRDTGFQGFVDSEGWQRLDVRGPAGDVLAVEAAARSESLG